MCGQLVHERIEYLPGVKKCLRCLVLVKQTRRSGRYATCLTLIYPNASFGSKV